MDTLLNPILGLLLVKNSSFNEFLNFKSIYSPHISLIDLNPFMRIFGRRFSHFYCKSQKFLECFKIFIKSSLIRNKLFLKLPEVYFELIISITNPNIYKIVCLLFKRLIAKNKNTQLRLNISPGSSAWESVRLKTA